MTAEMAQIILTVIGGVLVSIFFGYFSTELKDQKKRERKDVSE